jgi:phosphate transport system substrate-binding protein
MARSHTAFVVPHLLWTSIAFGAMGCDKSPPPDQGQNAAPVAASKAPAQSAVRASGSSALQPLINAAKEQYETTHSGASIEISAGGSKKGLTDVASGAVQIGNSDIFAPEDLKAKLVDHKVAVVGFAAMANKGPYNQKVTALSLEQLAKVFSGTIKNWKELGGSDQAITVINRAAGSGTRSVFGALVLGGDKFVESQTEDNSGALVTKLKQSTGAISYLALSFGDPELVVLSLKTGDKVVEPGQESITSGAYPIWSYEHMYTMGEPTGPTAQFISYVLSPEFQTGVLPKVKGFIPVVAMKVQREKDG